LKAEPATVTDQATICLVIDDVDSLTFSEINIRAARNGAIIFDEVDDLYVLRFPGEDQKLYTYDQLRAKLRDI
jgi:hypothetical protein